MNRLTLPSCLVALALLFLAGALSGQQAITPKKKIPTFKAEAVDGLSAARDELLQIIGDFDIVKLDIESLNQYVKSQGVWSQFKLQFPGEEALPFHLQLNDLRAPNYRAIATTDFGEMVLPKMPCNTYKGTINQQTNQMVRFTIAPDHIKGYFVDGSKNRFIEPLSALVNLHIPENYFVVYEIKNVLDVPGAHCGVSEMEEQMHQLKLPKGHNAPQRAVTNCTHIVELATDADWEWFQMYGANSNATIMTNINMVEGIYYTTFNMGFTIVFQNVWQTSADPYTAAGDPSSDILAEIRDEWNVNNATFMAVARDLVHVFSAKDHGTLLGSVSGGLPAVCLGPPDVAHGFTADRVGAFLTTAHEIGHNFNGVHGDGVNCGTNSATIMCQGIKNLVFSATSTTTIQDYIDANGACLLDNLPMASISCPGDNTFDTDPGVCERNLTVPDPTVVDDCGAVPTLELRYRENDGMGNTGPWSGYSANANITLGVGRWEIEWQADFNNGNTLECNFFYTIEDNEDPMPVCLNPTVDFNGEEEITVPIADIYDAVASSDNCGTVNLVSPLIDPIVACEDLGMVIPIVVTVNDGNGNTNDCTANITLDGLPCGWMDNGGIGCGGTTSDYDVPTETFELTVSDCAPSFPYVSDETAFVFAELCGNGEIIARVTDIQGAAFAGVMMRDSEAPNAPMVAMGTNRIDRVRKEVRIVPGYPAWPQAVLAYDQFWVRIVRMGNQFMGFASTDGINWIPYINQQVFFTNNCIPVGLYLYSEMPATPASASLDNVFVTGLNAPMVGLPGIVLRGEDVEPIPQIDIFPNPASEILHVDLSAFLGQEVQLQMVSSMGQLVSEKHYSEANALEALDVSNITPGIYSLVLTLGDESIAKRVVITR